MPTKIDTPASLKSALKRAGSGIANYRNGATLIAVSDVDGTAWLTNSYAVVRAERFASVFSSHNLDVTPGQYEVNGTVNRVSEQGPNMAPILKALGTEPIDFVRVASFPVIAKVGERECYAFGSLESPVFVRRELIDNYVPDAWSWTWAADPSKPLVARDGNGDVIGAVMPYRHA